MPIKLGFKNFYLYSAIELGTGDNLTLELPYVNTDCLNIFLDQLSKFYPNDKIILVMDGAGWHKSKKLVLPTNIAYVPDLLIRSITPLVIFTNSFPMIFYFMVKFCVWFP